MDALSVLQMAQGRNETPETSIVPSSREVEIVYPSEVIHPRKLARQKAKAESKTRARGTGHLYSRGGSWWFELHFAGERFRQSLNVPVGKEADRQLALDKMAAAVNAIRSGEQPKKFEPISVQAMYDAWIAECERLCKPRTVEDYKSRWSHLAPIFAKLTATQVTKDRVSDYLSRRMKEGAGPITQNRESRVLQMIFNANRSKIPADRFPEFPKMHSERNHVRKGRLSVEDYKTLQTRLNDPKLFWLRVFLTMTFKYGFRKGELLNAKVSYFNRKESTFTLPPFSTKNKMERVVDLVSGGEIFNMLAQLTLGRDPQAPLFTRNGKPVKDFRGQWAKLVEGIGGGSGTGGTITIHDLRRAALTNMNEKGIGAERAGTHLTADVFRRYISRSKEERQATAAVIES